MAKAPVLTARADDFTGRVPNADFGYGKIDAYEAARAIIGSSGTKPPTPDPVISSVDPATIEQGTTVHLGVNGTNFAGAVSAESKIEITGRDGAESEVLLFDLA